MSRRKLREFTSEGSIQIIALPRLETAITMGHKKRIKLLRLCPFSEFFGQSAARFNERIMNKTRSQIIVCDLIKQHMHLKSNLSSIEETDSILEASCSIFIGDILNDDQEEDNENDNNDEIEEEDGSELDDSFEVALPSR